ncbi:MAG: metallophosphoesterase [Methylobacter sp.]|nr:metallophosphoesterase [Methylobacter sp.]
MKAIFKKILNRKQSEPLPVGLPQNHRLYCIGDIHGRLDLLQEVHQKIASDAFAFDGIKILVYLGDYIDRGLYSKQVIDCLSENNFPEFKTVFLLGNHEQVLLEFLNNTDPSIAHEWFRFGGLPTLASYGVTVKGIPTAKDLEQLRAEFREKMPAAHLAFFERLVLNFEIGGYFFVHAGIRPKIKLHRQRPEDILWIREEFLNSDVFHGRVIVHGHSITDEPEIRHNRIGLDTGAYASGKLTCAVFEELACRFL